MRFIDSFSIPQFDKQATTSAAKKMFWLLDIKLFSTKSTKTGSAVPKKARSMSSTHMVLMVKRTRTPPEFPALIRVTWSFLFTFWNRLCNQIDHFFWKNLRCQDHHLIGRVTNSWKIQRNFVEIVLLLVNVLSSLLAMANESGSINGAFKRVAIALTSFLSKLVFLMKGTEFSLGKFMENSLKTR